MNWGSVIRQGFLPRQQLGIDLGQFLQVLMQLAVMLDSAASGLLLGGGLEQELVDLAQGQALGQVVEGAVLMAAAVAMAVRI